MSKSNRPPYEILRKGKQPWRKPGAADGTGEESGQTTSGDSALADSGVDTSGHHLWTLRLPRGYAVLLLLGILLIVGLAYWVGQQRGYRLAAELYQAQIQELNENQNRLQVGLPEVVEPGSRLDSREPGQWYLKLAEIPRRDGIRLVQFLRSRGVEAIGTVRHNVGLAPSDGLDRIDVWALRPFSGLDDPEITRFKRILEPIGKAWRQDQGGPDALENAALYQYQPSE